MDGDFTCVAREVYRLRLLLMNAKAFQTKMSNSTDQSPSHTEDLDTGEKSRERQTESDEENDGKIQNTLFIIKLFRREF